ncbi:diaminopimelate epimerase [Limnochorda pilosa]|uniref:Diaminopimelate epimerase n=1 Tax=Limnochorda pilosa TaxID=1555112 RepID=A0A0K2SKM9_LIMPI|nr:diaminopimelate epimerase [Limnochorda pilosa]
MEFAKLHGLGNSYVYLNLLGDGGPSARGEGGQGSGGERPVPPGALDWAHLARAVSDRGTGIGSDGLILILPSQVADARMRIFNADGSEGEMCGNGIRGVGKVLYDRGLVRSRHVRVETLAGILALELFPEDGRVQRARVQMGRPILEPARIPARLGDGRAPVLEVRLEGEEAVVTPVSMGNPHAVLFVDDLAKAPVQEWGPRLEHHPAFPNRTNVEFVAVRDAATLQMRVWERGSGETQACGTGACAAAVAAHLTGRAGREVAVHLPGGILNVRWDDSDVVWLEGPVEEVCQGRLDVEWLRRRGLLRP